MRFRPSNLSKRIKHLSEISASFIGQSIQAIDYFDCICDEHGNTFFDLDENTDYHEVALGVDLCFDNDRSLGYLWDTYRDPGDYELDLLQHSVSQKLSKAGGWKQIQVSDHPLLRPYIENAITGFTFSRSTLAHRRDDSVCDCRVDFSNAPSFWICTRAPTVDFRESGDEMIVVFDERYARKIGIQVNA